MLRLTTSATSMSPDMDDTMIIFRGAKEDVELINRYVIFRISDTDPRWQ
jgi:hypothetical protein